MIVGFAVVKVQFPGGITGLAENNFEGEWVTLHREGNFVWRSFVAESTKKVVTISSKDLASKNPDRAIDGVELVTYNRGNPFADALNGVRVERIVVLGLKNKPSKVTLGNTDLEFTFEDGVAAVGKKEGVASRMTIKDPGAFITSDWVIVLEL